MSDFLTEFVEYFFPTISTLPEWTQVLIGCFVLCFVFRIVCSMLHAFGGVKL